MKLVCSPQIDGANMIQVCDLEVVLFGRVANPNQGEVGASISEYVKRAGLQAPSRAWDLLSIALSVIAADLAVSRGDSTDGWTREIDLHVAVTDPDFWNSQKLMIEQQLRFLTTDIWQCTFNCGGNPAITPAIPQFPEEDCVALLSGGMDSLVGMLDLVLRNHQAPYAVSQIALGDKVKQRYFTQQIGGGVRHLQLNHSAKLPKHSEHSQRARSLLFLAYGVFAATTLQRYRQNQRVDVFVCENGFISINPPLTSGRVGSLSTRTTNPVFLRMFQSLLDSADLRVNVLNPYQFMTKGEMLAQCVDQDFLLRNAAQTTSCGRFGRMGFRHCGRCVPCIVRRAAFYAWGQEDRTEYVYRDLAIDDTAHAGFDDVRSMAMAIRQVRTEGINSLLGACLSSALVGNTLPYKQMVSRGIEEIGAFFDHMGIA